MHRAAGMNIEESIVGDIYVVQRAYRKLVWGDSAKPICKHFQTAVYGRPPRPTAEAGTCVNLGGYGGSICGFEGVYAKHKHKRTSHREPAVVLPIPTRCLEFIITPNYHGPTAY